MQALAHAAIDKKREMHLALSREKPTDEKESSEEVAAEEATRKAKRARVLAAKLGGGEGEN